MSVSKRQIEERKVRQDRILTGALEVFKSRGLENSTMEEIAAESGFGKATLYYYFRSKEEVFAAILQNGWQMLWISLEPIISKKISPRKTFIQILLYIAENIRKALAEKEREDVAIDMAVHIALQMDDAGEPVHRCIDTGLRVGLAILTEAVLVAPLAGSGAVRVLNNLDGTRFVSIDFCGPIRAAGGTAQALAVLIADMIRR